PGQRQDLPARQVAGPAGNPGSLPPASRSIRARLQTHRRQRRQLGSVHQMSRPGGLPLLAIKRMRTMGKEMAAATPGNEDEIDLRELVGVLLDHKWWIVAITA